MRKHPRTGRQLDQPPTNAESILEIPEGYITSEYRAQLLARAEAGEDVYAYGEDRLPDGIANVWDIDTRIPLFPLAQWRWSLDTFSPAGGERRFDWVLQFNEHGGGLVQAIVVTILRSPFERRAPYEDYAARRIRMIANYINLYGDDPAKYDGHNF